MFGSKPAFGTTGFGTQTSGGFGTTGLFGSQTPGGSTGGLFGTTTTQSGGLFGSGTSTFGQSTLGGGFGNQQPTGLFGSTGQQTSSLFSTPGSTTSSAFGTKAPGSTGFGTAVQGSNAFGTPGGSTSTLFGGTNPSGSSTTGSLFGSTTTSTFTAQTGTTIKFNPPTGQDTMLKSGVSTNISTRHQCITAMKEYESKSLEELRMEDYLANRKGPQAGSTGLFATPQTSQAQTAFTFGTQNKTTGFGGFGQTTSSGTSLFGQQSQTGGLFGSAGNKTTFGTTTTTASTGFGGFGSGTSMFGQNTTNKSIFGQPASTQSTGLFGSTQTGTSSFGGFGGTQTGFGTSTTGGLFGSKPTSFAQPTTNTGLTFGQQNTLSTGGLFGNKPAGQTGTGLTFGQSSTTGFGNTGSLFGNKTTGFGTGTNTLGSTGFGQTNTNLGGGFGTGLFSGTQNKPGIGGLGTGFGFNLNNPGLAQSTTNTGVLGQTVSQNQDAEILEQLRKTLIYSPYGDSPLFRNLHNDTVLQDDLLKPTNPLAQKAALSSQHQYKVSPTSTSRIKPKPLTITSDKSQLFDGLEEEDLTFGNVTFVPRRSIKKLNIKGSSSFSRQDSPRDTTELDTSQPMSSPQKANGQQNDREQSSPILKSSPDKLESSGSISVPHAREKRVHLGLFQNISGSFLDDTISELNSDNKHNSSDENRDENETSEANSQSAGKVNEEPAQPHPAGIVLHRHGYYTIPSLDELADMVDSNGDCIVDDFVVGREGYGNVMFPGKTNVANLNLDDIVHFRRKEITVYPIDEEKPPEGTGLNKKAQVTLDCVWPSDKCTREYVTDPECLKEMHYQEKLEKITAKIGAKFLDYRPETGSWVFEVKHFSKYGLLEDDDDNDDLSNLDPKKLSKLKEDQPKQLAVQKQPIKVITGQKPPVLDHDDKVLQKTSQQKSEDQLLEPKKIDDVPHLYPLLNDEELNDDLLKETEPKFLVEMDELEPLDKLPASHQLASHLGVKTEDLQLRKASFFGDEEFTPAWKAPVTDQPKPVQWAAGRTLLSTGYPRSTTQLSSPQKTLMPHSLATPFNGLFTSAHKHDTTICDSAPVQTTAVKKSFPVVASRLKRKIPPLNNSLLENKQNLLMDLGLMHGKRFRIGWAPHWSLVHGGRPLGEATLDKKSDMEYSEPQKIVLLQEKDCVEKSKLGTDDQQLLIEQLIVSPLQETTEQTSLLHQAMTDHLKVQLKHTQISLEFKCPQAVPDVGNNILKPLISCAENALKVLDGSADCHLYKQAGLVWTLCHALWGDLDDPLVEDAKQDSYAYQIARQEAVSAWFEKAVSSTVHQKIEQTRAMGGSEASVIFQHLTGHQLEQACDVAQQEGDHQLALLIGQASGMDDIRDYVQHQLIVWEQSEMDQFIKPERLKIYALLAGKLVWRTSDGNIINVCEGLDWKRAMALHLWYCCQPTCTVSEALNSYNEGFKSKLGNHYAAPPLPPFLEAAMENEDKQDTCYQLIQLFCERSHPLHTLLSPTSAIPNHLDYRISWQLSQVLQALEFTHLSQYHSAMLCTNFAAQLESMGLWQWAIFVLMHISDHQSREHAVIQLVQRHITLAAEEEKKEEEMFLLDLLKIPSQWIHEAKAIRAGHCNEKEEEAWHWLKAGQWNKAHQLILNHLASKAIVNENFADLKCLLCELGSPEISSTIEDWDTGGRVFLDYITMIETLQQLQQSEPSANELDKLQSEVCQLSRCIIGLKCHTATDRLCQSEMAKRAANLMRTLLQMKADGDDINEMLVTQTTDLPLPEDYALQELHQLTRCYMIGLTMA